MGLRPGYSDNPVLAEAYDLVPRYVNRPDKEFYLQSAASSPGKILELGCGTGRILIPIAANGHAITGLDISDNMLAKCRQKLKSLPGRLKENVRLVKADMTSFKLDDVFHLAIMPGHAFQHLISIDDQMTCLSVLNRHLLIKARLIFDVVNVDFTVINNPRNSEEIEDLPDYALPDGRRLRQTGRMADFHPAEQYNDVEIIHYLTDVNGTTERIVQAFPFRYFFRYEVEHLLARCGFKISGLFGNFDKSPLAHNSPEMIFVAEKYREI